MLLRATSTLSRRAPSVRAQARSLSIRVFDKPLRTIPFSARFYLQKLERWFPSLKLKFVACQIEDPLGYFAYERIGQKSQLVDESFEERLRNPTLQEALLSLAEQHASDGPCVLVITHIGGVKLDYHAYISMLKLQDGKAPSELAVTFNGKKHATKAFELFPSQAAAVIRDLLRGAKIALNGGDDVTVTDLLSYTSKEFSSAVVSVATNPSVSKWGLAKHAFGGLLPHFVLHRHRTGDIFSVKAGFGHQIAWDTPGMGISDWVNVGNGGLAWIVAEVLAAELTLPTAFNRTRARLLRESVGFHPLRAFNWIGGKTSRGLLQPMQSLTFPRPLSVLAAVHGTVCAILFLLLLAVAHWTSREDAEPESDPRHRRKKD
jgi:hypothetical protein